MLRQHALGIDGLSTAIPDEVVGDAGKEEWGQARPAIANERLSVNRAGQVVLTLKTAYRDGTLRRARFRGKQRGSSALANDSLCSLRTSVASRATSLFSRLNRWIRLLRFAKQHHSREAPIAFIESHRCNAARHSDIYALRIDKRQPACGARDGRCT